MAKFAETNSLTEPSLSTPRLELHNESRRDFLINTTAATAAVAAAPLLTASDTEAAARKKVAATAASGAAPDKLETLAPFKSVDAGQPITTNVGLKIADNQNSLKAGTRGPILLEDHILREKITHFDHERIPERVVHARGAGAHGYFQSYESMATLTKAKFLQNPKAKTPVFVRFSTVVGSRGAADTARDARGFAVKFYTEEGNYDLVGNNIPVFFIQDAMKFPDLVHAVKPEPDREIPQASSAHDTFWDFISLMPESMHMIMWVMSDRGIPRSFRMMEGFGVHTFRLINAQGVSCFVKFHWKPMLGVHALAWDEAQKLAGKDPDFHRRDLADAIDAGDFPEWELGVQIITEADEHKFDFDILDATKLIPEELVPVRRIGKMTLNRNPDNYFAETEQVMFNPSHVVPGIDFSNDPLLQGRLFSYLDTQLSRLGGPNFQEIPINRAICPFHNMQRDGSQRQTIAKGRVSYEPSSIDVPAVKESNAAQGGFVTYPEKIDGAKLRKRSESFADHYSQAALFWKSQTAPEQQHIVDALQFELAKVNLPAVQTRMLSNLTQVDRELASRIAVALGIEATPPAQSASVKQMKPSAALSMIMRGNPKTIKGRKIAILAADGVDSQAIETMNAALMAAGANAKVVAPHLGSLSSSGGKPVAVDHTIATMPSIMFDALFIPGGAQSVASLRVSGDAMYFLLEAYKHGKAIALSAEATELLTAAGLNMAGGRDVEAESGIVVSSAKGDIQIMAKSFIDAIGQHRHWSRAYKDAIPA